jgi:hypothetical protein
MSPNGGTHPQVVAHSSRESGSSGGLTPRLQMVPITSMSHPQAFRG